MGTNLPGWAKAPNLLHGCQFVFIRGCFLLGLIAAVGCAWGGPAFHANYRDVGAFPGTEGLFSTKEILTRIYKAVGSPLTPIL